MSHFFIGALVLFGFLFLEFPLLMYIPGFAFKIAGTIILFVGGLMLFGWLVPEATYFGSRAAFETAAGEVLQSVSDLGEYVENDIGGLYRHNKWLNAQREKHESGFFEEDGSVRYYNAEQDMEYYKRPDGRWQPERGGERAIVDSPFSRDAAPSGQTENTSSPVQTAGGWQKIMSAEEITGVFEGTAPYTMQGSKSEKLWTLFYNKQDDTIILEQTTNCTYFIDDLLTSQKLGASLKDHIWAILLEQINGPEIVETGKYWFKIRIVTTARNIGDDEFYIDSTQTKIKLIESAENGDNEIILYKQ
jgi:hypothetical protein